MRARLAVGSPATWFGGPGFTSLQGLNARGAAAAASPTLWLSEAAGIIELHLTTTASEAVVSRSMPAMPAARLGPTAFTRRRDMRRNCWA
jgi:hypothetical protein